MSIVNTAVPITAKSCEEMILALVEKYPFCRTELLTTTAFSRPIRTLVIGTGPRKVIYTAAHHANEWITALLLLKFAEDFAAALEAGGTVGGVDARAMAVCAMAEELHRSNGQEGIASTSIGGVRVQYREDRDRKLLRRLADCAGIYLDIYRGRDLCAASKLQSV